jgi:hypothetical protein
MALVGETLKLHILNLQEPEGNADRILEAEILLILVVNRDVYSELAATNWGQQQGRHALLF